MRGAQVSTGDGWAVHIARPLIGNAVLASNGTAVTATGVSDTPEVPVGNVAPPEIHRAVALFFVGFFFLCGIGLLGIVHAVPLPATCSQPYAPAIQTHAAKLVALQLETESNAVSASCAPFADHRMASAIQTHAAKLVAL